MVQSPVREREVVRGRLPAARRDRRPALAALAVLLILLGALGSALIAFRSNDRVSVLATARTIQVGDTVSASDFRVEKVAGSTQNLVSSQALRSFVGSHALVGVPAGTMINGAMFSKARIVPDSAEEVGVVVNAKQRPGQVPEPGDVVRLYFVTSDTAQSGNQQYTAGQQVAGPLRVLSVTSGGSADVRNITVVARRQDAGNITALSATSNLAISILPSDTDPVVDLVSPGS